MESFPADPILLFRQWYDEALRAGVRHPEEMTLATATADGRPSARIVLLRGLDDRGFVFYSNRSSRKGQELADNPRAALVFHWPAAQRQVRVEGAVAPVTERESDRYFADRPRGSQIGAHASPQSEVIPDRAFLEKRVAQFEARFAGGAVPRPPHWGGYRVDPEVIEFWQERDHRLHDRIRYRREAGRWLRERLAP